MNKAQLARSVGTHVQVRPRPLFRGLPTQQDWIIGSFGKDYVQLENPGAGYRFNLGLDQIREFMTDPGRARGETRFGFLHLKVQLTLQGREVIAEPIW